MPGTIFSRQTMKNRDWKEARSHVQGNHTVRPGHVREQARRMVREKVTELLNAMPDASGGRDRQRREIRAFRRTEGVPGRPLRPEPDRQAGRLELKVPKLKGALFASAVIERYRRRGESVEEALIGMYPAVSSTSR